MNRIFSRSWLPSLVILPILACYTLVRAKPDPIPRHFPPFTLADGTAVRLTFAVDPDSSAFQLSATETGRQIWNSREYALELNSRQDSAGACLVSFSIQRKDGNPFTLQQYSLDVNAHYASRDGIWSYNDLPWCNFVNSDLEAPFSMNTAANTGIPFVVLVDKKGINKLALGLLRQDRFVQLRGQFSSDLKIYTLSAEELESFPTERAEETFFVSRAPKSWFETAQAYTAAVDRHRNYVPLPVPESLFNPTFDSWYFTGDGVDQQLVWQLAQISHQLGFKSYLLDAGWDTTPGQYSLGINGSTGDYSPAPLYFPDFPALLSQIRNQLGMRVMLWMQQYALGQKSVYYSELRNLLYYILDPKSGTLTENPALCPRVGETRSHMADLFQRVMEQYHPDSLWFDWQDQIPLGCLSSHMHDAPVFGDAYNETQRIIQSVIQESNPDAFVEMRWPFANLNNKPYSQLWQPLDSANEFENMRLQAMKMRAFSSGVFVGTDEMYWKPDIPDSEAARFMATVVFTGIPYFGPNLLRESQPHLDMLKAWLQFYQNNKEDLAEGIFEPYGDLTHPDQKIVGTRTTFIYYGQRYAGPVECGSENTRIYIVNASALPGIDLTLSQLPPGWYSIEISDLFLNPKTRFPRVFLNSNPQIRYNVPVGCNLTLTRLSQDVGKGRRGARDH